MKKLPKYVELIPRGTPGIQSEYRVAEIFELEEGTHEKIDGLKVAKTWIDVHPAHLCRLVRPNRA